MVTILQNSVKLACLENAFLKIEIFGILVCNLLTKPDMSKNIDFMPLHGYQNLVKISDVPSVAPAIFSGGSGGVSYLSYDILVSITVNYKI